MGQRKQEAHQDGDAGDRELEDEHRSLIARLRLAGSRLAMGRLDDHRVILHSGLVDPAPCARGRASSPGSETLQARGRRHSCFLVEAMRSRRSIRLIQLVALSIVPALAVIPLKLALKAALGQNVDVLPAVAAVVIAAWLGGFIPGLVTTGISMFIEAVAFLEPVGRLDVASETDRIRLVLFGLVGLLTSSLAWLRDRAETASRRASTAAELAAERTDLMVRRLSALQGLAAELAGALTRDHITDALLTHGIASLQADAAVVFYVDPGGNHLEAIGSRGYSSASEQVMSILPLDIRTPASDVARTGEPVFIEDPAEYAERYGPSLASHGIEVLLHSVAAVPLAIDGRDFGVLAFTWDLPHEFAEDRREFIAAIARLGASALERARLSFAEIGHAAEVEAVIGALGEGIIVIGPDGSVRSEQRSGRPPPGRTRRVARRAPGAPSGGGRGFAVGASGESHGVPAARPPGHGGRDRRVPGGGAGRHVSPDHGGRLPGHDGIPPGTGAPRGVPQPALA